MRDESNTPSDEAATERPAILLVAFDVTGLSDDEISWLEMEAAVQAEESEEYPEQGHPDVKVIGGRVIRDAIKHAAILRDFEQEED